MNVDIDRTVVEYIRTLPEKDRRILMEHIERLSEHPNALGNIKKLHTRKPRWRVHVSSKYTIFYFVEGSKVLVDLVTTQEIAHKRYGKI